MIQTKFGDKTKTHTFNVQQPFSPESRAVYVKKWKNIVDRGRPQMAI